MRQYFIRWVTRQSQPLGFCFAESRIYFVRPIESMPNQPTSSKRETTAVTEKHRYLGDSVRLQGNRKPISQWRRMRRVMAKVCTRKIKLGRALSPRPRRWRHTGRDDGGREKPLSVVKRRGNSCRGDDDWLAARPSPILPITEKISRIHYVRGFFFVVVPQKTRAKDLQYLQYPPPSHEKWN